MKCIFEQVIYLAQNSKGEMSIKVQKQEILMHTCGKNFTLYQTISFLLSSRFFPPFFWTISFQRKFCAHKIYRHIPVVNISGQYN